MISKELLSAIFNIDCTEVESNGNTIYWYTREGGIARSNINVYELANKCKEWALKVKNKNYYIWTGINHNSKWDVFVTEFKSLDTFEPVRDQAVFEPLGAKDTEPEAVFRACEWILKETK